MIEVRLRFVAVLVGLGFIIGYWDTIQNYWDRWTRPTVTSASNVNSGSEFYCPMDPAVLRPGLEPNGAIPKCPICGMPLSLRKKGAPMVLPPGVVGRVSLSPNRIRMAGIRTSEISLRPMQHTIRTVGNVMHDESRQSQIVSRINGYIEKLYIDKTYTQVHKGDPLAEVYSPDVYAAVQELKIAQSIPGSSLAGLARDKIRLLGIEDAEIDKMLKGGDNKYRVIVRAPADGHVIRKLVQQGATISAGQMLFEIADLHFVWIEAEIYERDLAMIHSGQEIEAYVEAYPQTIFKGQIDLIYPELNTATRTNRVRFAIHNHEHRLRHGMYATVTLTTPVQETEPFHTTLVSSQSVPSDPAAAIKRQDVCPVTGAKLGSMGKPVSIHAAGQAIYLCCAGCERAIIREPEKYVSRMQMVSDTGVLSVPETAVIDTGNEKIVYVEREAGVFEGLEVQLGPKSNGYYAVISGLLPGDKVAASGAFLIDAETRLNPTASASYFGASGNPSRGTATDSVSGTALDSVSGTATDSVSGMALAAGSKLGNGMSKEPVASAIPLTKSLTATELAEIAKLPEVDQKLAKQQVLCPITMEPLGSMGLPIKVPVGDDAVFVCCEGCKKGVLRDSEKMLELVRQWRSANK